MNHIGIKVTLVIALCSVIYFGFLKASSPPKDQYHICKLFKHHPTWYWAAKDAQKKWDVPISTQMAIIRQESHFRADAQTPRTHLLGFIPWRHETTASGYTQAVDETWRLYLREEKKRSASRANFANATDFIGWYAHRIHLMTNVMPSDTYAIYLAYHEGVEGFVKRTYEKKSWLKSIARNVSAQANIYHAQLLHCQSTLPKRHWWNAMY